MIDYVLDSNIFDYILDNNIDVKTLRESCNLYVTNVQISEISNISNEDRRVKLQKLIAETEATKLYLESGIWCDDLTWDDGQPWMDEVNEDCIDIKGNTSKPRSWHDALIGEVVKKHGYTLVTNDGNFRSRANASGILTLTAKEFCEKYT